MTESLGDHSKNFHKKRVVKEAQKCGAKLKDVDFVQLQKLCEMHCTMQEIVDFLDIIPIAIINTVV